MYLPCIFFVKAILVLIFLQIDEDEKIVYDYVHSYKDGLVVGPRG